MSSEPIKLVTGKTDQELCDDLRKRLIECYQPLLALADEANNLGIVFQIDIGPNAFGKFQIQRCQFMKVFE